MSDSASGCTNFLGVERSALGLPWRPRLDSEGAGRALAMAQQHGMGDILARVIAGRGVAIAEAQIHLDPTIRRLMPDPFGLQGMEAAVARLAYAIERGEKIALLGDYDVDGATSVALLAGFLEAANCPFVIHIPDRIFEGYGPNVEAVRALAQSGATLLVCVDCGTTSPDAIGEASRLGLEAVIIDHHQAPEVLPAAAAVINPNRLDDLSGLGHLCAAGVAYMVLVALNRRLRHSGFWGPQRQAPDLLEALDLVALATIADVVPLVGLNRAFVSKGLAVMRSRRRPGLRALMDIAGADGPPRSDHLGFMVGPRLNAGGRIGDAALGAKLLMLKDDVEADRCAADLDRLNRERQALEAATVEAAESEVLASLGLADHGATIVAAAQGWHPGVVGLVAARLKERFRRPAFAIALNGGTGTGSGRSIPGVDLGRAVRAAVEEGILLKGGGHAMAAGVTVALDRLGDFRAFMEERLALAIARAQRDEALLVDAAISAGGANAEFVSALARAGPFGSGNPEPVFALPAHRIVEAAVVGNGHIKFRALAGDGMSLDAIAFKAASGPLGQAVLAARSGTMHLAGTLSVDRWRGRERVQLRLIDVAAAHQYHRVSRPTVDRAPITADLAPG